MIDECTFGKISRGKKPIQAAEWDDLIASSDYLQPMPDKVGKNPFTQEEIVFSGAGKALYKNEDDLPGNASLFDGVISTTGIPEQKCRNLAMSLGAVYEIDDRS